jgi:hypothetical protein
MFCPTECSTRKVGFWLSGVYDRTIGRLAVEQEAFALQFADDSLRNDKDFVLEVLKMQPEALAYAAPKRRTDPDCLLEAAASAAAAAAASADDPPRPPPDDHHHTTAH